jgi:hypothetical protein
MAPNLAPRAAGSRCRQAPTTAHKWRGMHGLAGALPVLESSDRDGNGRVLDFPRFVILSHPATLRPTAFDSRLVEASGVT